MVAESGNDDSDRIAGLEDGSLWVDLELIENCNFVGDIIDEDFDLILA